MQTANVSKTSFKVFTPGPTKIADDILKIGAEQLPYNRTRRFSNITFEIIDGLKYIFQTKGDVAILTSSGTGAMEASTLNFLSKDDLVLVINGGAFGERWCNLCKIHGIPFEELRLKPGQDVSSDQIARKMKTSHFTALLINAHETSTGALYDIENIGKLAKEYNVLFIVDAISTICADTFLMDEWHVDVALLSSQKALALPPGLSFVALNDRAKEKMDLVQAKSLYFDLKGYLKNQERGQMPYTPAIGIFLMLHKRLIAIRKTGVEASIKEHADRATFFRTSIKELPLTMLPEHPSNSMTAIMCNNHINASKVVSIMEAKYNTYLAPNGKPLEKEVFRVSHMGAQTNEDAELLINNLKKAINFAIERGD